MDPLTPEQDEDDEHNSGLSPQVIARITQEAVQTTIQAVTESNKQANQGYGYKQKSQHSSNFSPEAIAQATEEATQRAIYQARAEAIINDNLFAHPKEDTEETQDDTNEEDTQETQDDATQEDTQETYDDAT